MDLRREPVFESENKKTAPTLAEFARKSQITEDKVWELIEEGQVSARFVNESILIMQDQPTIAVSNFEESPTKEPQFDREPNVPEFMTSPIEEPKRATERKAPPKTPTFAEKFQQFKAPEPSRTVLEDYDFKEDSNELLTFAQDALSRTAELSKELLATKNELIRLKDERIAFLTDLLRQKDHEIKSLHRNIEELATLNNFEKR